LRGFAPSTILHCSRCRKADLLLTRIAMMKVEALRRALARSCAARASCARTTLSPSLYGALDLSPACSDAAHATWIRRRKTDPSGYSKTDPPSCSVLTT